jgi:heme exporter protein D
MIWDSWRDFFAMGGYALYVWGSVLVVFACMAGESLLVWRRFTAVRKQLRQAGARRRHGPAAPASAGSKSAAVGSGTVGSKT